LATISGEHAGGFAGAVTDAERLFLGDAESAGELVSNIGFEVKHRILQQFNADFDEVGEFECVNGFLIPRRVRLGDGGVFCRPLRLRMRGRNGNLALSAGGDGFCQATQHVSFL